MNIDNLPPEFVALSIGSNLGDSRKIIERTLELLAERIRNMRVSSLYRSDPLYVTNQPAFINAAVIGLFDGDAEELLSFIQSIETHFGRVRTRLCGERTLDIDILLFSNQVIYQPPRLIIPHPAIKERRFVLIPLLELVVDLRDPITEIPYAILLETLPIQGIYYIGMTSYNQINNEIEGS